MGDNMTKKIMQQIKIKLIKLNMTQQDLANLFSTTRQNVNGVLSGRSSSLKLEEKLLEWLYFGTVK